MVGVGDKMWRNDGFGSNTSVHNIIKIHNNVMWDWQYFTKYSTIQTEHEKYTMNICPSHRTNIVDGFE